MIGFSAIQRIIVPQFAVNQAVLHLRQMGVRHLEGFSLWAGRARGDVFEVEANIIPEQTGYQLEAGVCVAVDGPELHRLNVWLFQHEMSVIAQLHSHPTDAYHSDTDDAYPIATTIGCVSLVLPDFARHSFALSRCAVYRLNSQLEWLRLDDQEAFRLIRIEDE